MREVLTGNRELPRIEFRPERADEKLREMSEPSLSELKSRAQLIKPSIRLGKAGLTPEFLAEFAATQRRTPLLKLKFEHFKDERKAMTKRIAEQTGSRVIQQVGHTAVFYRAAAPSDSGEA
jgi:RNA-binding protein